MEGNQQLAIIIPMLRHVAAGIGREQLGSPTPCTELTVAGVLDHMTGLASAFAPMFRGEAVGDGGATAHEAGDVAAFDGAMEALLDAVQSPGALERRVDTPGGPMSGGQFARLVALDGLIHGWDLAVSTGQEWQPSDDLVADVDGFARQAISPEMRAAGAFDAERESPAHAAAMERLVAFSGRTV